MAEAFLARAVFTNGLTLNPGQDALMLKLLYCPRRTLNQNPYCGSLLVSMIVIIFQTIKIVNREN